MNFLKTSLIGSAIVMSMTLATAASAFSSDVDSLISDSKLDSLQQRALTQYADSLETILSTDTQNREQVIETNKLFMNAQQCLAQVYSRDQKPYMMRVSRKIYEAIFADQDKLAKYHEFLGQAQQEGDLAIPSSGNACRR